MTSFGEQPAGHYNKSKVRQSGYLAGENPPTLVQIGLLLGVALLTLASSAFGQTFTDLVNFNGTNGANPFYLPLVQAGDGNLYGTTASGGAFGSGSVFRLTPSGTLTTLYSFCSVAACADGSFPLGGLVLATDGNLYGTTADGGASSVGTFYRITTAGKLTTLHSFISSEAALPESALVQAANGNFYGTSFEGGAVNGGTVYEVTRTGTVVTRYSFCSQSHCSDGADPAGGALALGSDGNFYGVTPFGGDSNLGVVFKITPTGVFTKLHDFSSTDGAQPWGTLIQIGSFFYGTAAAGGASSACAGGCGTIFKVSTTGVVTTLRSFILTDGESPVAGLIQGTDGNLYGTTLFGGSGNDGTIFKSTLSGTVTSLHSFSGTDGEDPYSALVQHTNGTFYGATNGGGMTSCVPSGCGTLFSESVGMGAFVRLLPTSGKVGSSVLILGTGLKSATSVAFNGTAAVFTATNTEIKTTVPTGATSGRVTVVTSSGTLTSNVNFVVK